MYCHVVQAGFYSDAIECWPVTQVPQVQSLALALVIRIFHLCPLHVLLNCFTVAFVDLLYQILGPVVQSVVSLTSLLRVIVKGHFVNCFSGFNIHYSDIFAEKNVSSFCTADATHIFSAKNFSIFGYHDVNFNESLTNDIVSFEQLGPVLFDVLLCYKLFSTYHR